MSFYSDYTKEPSSTLEYFLDYESTHLSEMMTIIKLTSELPVSTNCRTPSSTSEPSEKREKDSRWEYPRILVQISWWKYFKILVRNWREYPSKDKNYITNYITYKNWYVKIDCTIAYPRFLTTVQGGAIVGTVLEMPCWS